MRWFSILGVAIFLSGIAYFRTDGFTPNKIAHTTKGPSIEADLEAKNVLSQPFHYLGKGRQCFVFASQDDRYVLKFFNRSYFEMPWYGWIFGEKERIKREKRRLFFENSYLIAWKELGDEILYVHIGKSSDLPFIKLVGPTSFPFSINLNDMAFVLQRKGEPFYSRLQAIYEKEGLLGLKREISSFTSQISLRIQKQIADDDSDVEHNWGYIEGKIVHLDPGRLYFDPRLAEAQRKEREWNTATRHFFRWLAKSYPEALPSN